jgi:cyclopropane fatty-acyl-phospholipid synthase-like methyltransferase
MNANPDWWKDFFSGLVVEFWETAIPPAVTAAETEFLVRELRLAPGARVLDVPCGHGRHALELARQGHEIQGVDISRELLATARRAAAAARANLSGSVSFLESDMRNLPWRDAFDAAFCAGSSFGFLGDAGDSEFLAAVARALRPGGRFLLDASKAAESLLPAFRERHSFEKDGLRFEAENRYEPRSGTIENRYTLTRASDGATETKLAVHRVYTASQLCAMLEAAGFRIEALYGSTDSEPFRLGTPLFILASATHSP